MTEVRPDIDMLTTTNWFGSVLAEIRTKRGPEYVTFVTFWTNFQF